MAVTYPDIPPPSNDMASLVASVAALKETVETLIKLRGTPELFVLNVKDLIQLGVLEPWVLDVLRKGGQGAAGRYLSDAVITSGST